jgi:signal transduction histidine kinase
MLDKIERSFATQRHFMQDISHELRTPLTILKGELEVALKRDRSQDEYSSILRSNLEEINNINRIVENLLMLLRFDTGEAALKKESVDAAVLLESVINDLRAIATQKNLTVTFLSGDIGKIILEADKEKLRRAFINIIDNAIKYTPPNGNISVLLDKEKDYVKIVFKDTGMGIAKEDLPFIFDRFYRADKSRSDSSFGLGLSIVKSIVESHRGFVEAASRPGDGTEFTIRLPII